MEASITISNILIQVIFPPVFQDMSESPKDLFLLFLNTLICSSSPDVLLTRGRLLFNILSLSLSPSLFFSSSHFHLSHHIHAHACAGLSDQLQADPLHLPNTNPNRTFATFRLSQASPLVHVITSVRNIHPHPIGMPTHMSNNLPCRTLPQTPPPPIPPAKVGPPLCSLPQEPVHISPYIYHMGYKCLSISALDCEHLRGKSMMFCTPESSTQQAPNKWMSNLENIGGICNWTFYPSPKPRHASVCL